MTNFNVSSVVSAGNGKFMKSFLMKIDGTVVTVKVYLKPADEVLSCSVNSYCYVCTCELQVFYAAAVLSMCATKYVHESMQLLTIRNECIPTGPGASSG